MKKIIIIILLILIMRSSVNAGPFVKFEAGPSLNVNNVYFTETIIGYSFKFWEIESRTYGGWLTWAIIQNGKNDPFMDIYSINQKFIYKNWFIRFQHYCAHTVNYYYNDEHNIDGQTFSTTKPSPYWWCGTTRTISIGFEYK